MKKKTQHRFSHRIATVSLRTVHSQPGLHPMLHFCLDLAQTVPKPSLGQVCASAQGVSVVSGIEAQLKPTSFPGSRKDPGNEIALKLVGKYTK